MKTKKWLRPEGDGAEREKRGSSFPPPGFSFYPSCFLISFHDTKRERRSTTREFGKRLISSRLRPFSTIRSLTSNIDYVPISSICSHPLLPPHPRLLSLPLPLLLLLALSPSLPLPPSLRFPVARFRFWQLSSPRFKIGIVDRSRVKSPSLPRNVTFDSFRTGLTRPVLSKERETRAGRRVWAQKIHLKMPEGRAKVSK